MGSLISRRSYLSLFWTQILRWRHEGPAWPKFALCPWPCYFSLLRTCWIPVCCLPTCGYLWSSCTLPLIHVTLPEYSLMYHQAFGKIYTIPLLSSHSITSQQMKIWRVFTYSEADCQPVTGPLCEWKNSVCRWGSPTYLHREGHLPYFICFI